MQPVLRNLDPLLAKPVVLSAGEFDSLVAFVRNGLLDPRVERHALCALVPSSLPSGMSPMRFEGCPQTGR
jgi:cytochrome c peroxidase